MPRGSKRRYTDKQKRRAEHIEEGMRKRGMSAKEAGRRAWMTVNAISRGAEKRGGSGYGKPENHAPMRKGGRKGAAARSASSRSRGAKKAAQTRKRNAAAEHRHRSEGARKAARTRARAR